jgi:predicted RNA-binding Zn ribbon-like protein
MSENHDHQPEPRHDEELFVEFANTLSFDDGFAREHLPDGATLARWLDEHDLVTRPSPATAERALPSFRALRQLIHEVTERVAAAGAPSGMQVRAINRVLRDGLHYHQLLPAGRGGFTVSQVGDEVDQARAAIAGSLAHYLADHDVSRVRVCANDGCRWRFIDRSPTGRRRWCDMSTCGNRAKVARHRARRRGDAAARGSTPTRRSDARRS